MMNLEDLEVQNMEAGPPDEPPGNLASPDPEPKSDTRPVVKIGEFFETVEAALDILPLSDNLFQRDGRLVRVVPIGEEEKSKHLPGKSVVIRDVGLSTLKENLSRAARWERLDVRKKKWVLSAPSRDVTAAVHDHGSYRKVPTLIGIVEAPFLRPDGSICTTPGYDKKTGFLYHPNIDFPPVPKHPSEKQARESWTQLVEVFEDFPFVDDTHLAVAISGILTVLARPMLGNTPLGLCEASTRGTGKTLVNDAVSVITTGRPIPKLGWPAGRDYAVELEKILAAVAMDGSSLICFDNLKVGARLGGAALDSKLTANGPVKFRVLGKSETPELIWKTVIFANGNNAVAAVQDETKRRVIPCRMVPDCERPEERTDFKHPDLLRWVTEERGRLVVAALTVLRHWVVSGKEELAGAWGSFEEWVRVIPSSIIAAGGPNIMEARKLITETDNEDDLAFVTLLETLCERFIYGATSREIIADADSNSVLREALDGVLDGDRNTRKLGSLLRGKKDRILGGYKLTERTAKRHSATVWIVVASNNPPGSRDITNIHTANEGIMLEGY
ncbi:MAG: hypothetical protein GY854_14955 [Deltaproteobacteria bacterium]|nr:hypothetical protein [Deltaproteobacteria bacterium]